MPPPIPLSVRYCLLAGGTLISSLSSRLPEGIQDFGLWLGIALAAVGLLSLVVHYLKHFRPKLSLPRLLTRIFPDPVKRDTSLAEALTYLGNRKWGGDYRQEILQDTPAPEDSLNRLGVFRQAAVDKEIMVWGRLQKRLPLVEINSDYWETWQLDYMSLLKGEASTEKSVNASKYSDKYHDLMVNKSQFEAKWARK